MPEPFGIGYRKPPAQHQFKKGQSGNPAGRPRKNAAPATRSPILTDIGEIVLEEARRPIAVTENGKTT